MAKKYKISRKNLNEFFSFFGKKQTPDEIRKIIDNDPVLRKLDKDIGDMNDKAAKRMEKELDPGTLNILKKYGLY